MKGLLLGFIIAAPTGPIGILCARRVLTHGRRAAFASGMGAAAADVIYGFIAAFGLTFISHLLVQYISGSGWPADILLCFIGARTFRSLRQTSRSWSAPGGCMQACSPPRSSSL